MPSGQQPNVEQHILEPRAGFPNSPLAVLLYRAAFEPRRSDALAPSIEQTFAAHGWSAGWRDGVYDYAHYHSNAHEVLGCYAGHARIELGGGALTVELRTGDVLVLPAGTAHRNVGATDDFRVVGAYAGGRHYDMRRAHDSKAEHELAKVPLPAQDPVLGEHGPLPNAWR